MPIMTYVADKFNYSYSGNFFEHYTVFFTKYTDFTGADGGFSFGQFWFLLYLFVISVVGVGLITFLTKVKPNLEKTVPFWIVLVLGIPLPLLSELFSVGGKSLVEYAYFFLLGYYVFSDNKIVDKTEKSCLLLLIIGLIASVLNVYLFIWSKTELLLINTITKYISEWIMVIALIGVAKKYLNFSGKISEYMNKRSFLFYVFHFVWVVLLQYTLYEFVGDNIFILFIGTVLLSYFGTFACCEISIRVPVLCFLTGTKYNTNK